MLLNRGELEGTRLLGRKSVEYMRLNQLPNNKDMAAMGQPVWSETSYDGIGFGLGFAVVIDPVKAHIVTSPGELHWGGAAALSSGWIRRKIFSLCSSLSCYPRQPIQFVASCGLSFIRRWLIRPSSAKDSIHFVATRLRKLFPREQCIWHPDRAPPLAESENSRSRSWQAHSSLLGRNWIRHRY